MNPIERTTAKLAINPQTFYYLIGGTVFKVSSFEPLADSWIRNADAVIHESGSIIKNNPSVNLDVLTTAIRENLTDAVKTTSVQIIELEENEVEAYDHKVLLKIAASVRAIYKK